MSPIDTAAIPLMQANESLHAELAALRERQLKTRNALIDELLLCPCGCSPTAAGSIPDDCKGAGKECKSRACALARAALALLDSPATAPPNQPHPDTERLEHLIRAMTPEDGAEDYAIIIPPMDGHGWRLYLAGSYSFEGDTPRAAIDAARAATEKDSNS